MTKNVRIENADSANYKVLVQVWDKGAQMPDGLGGLNQAPDTLVQEVVLHNPCDMTSGLYITNTRYLVIKEAAPTPAPAIAG
jgi:hypothetical protein